MPIDTNFKFGQVVNPPAGLAPGLAPPADPRGLLAGFVGNLPLALPGQDNPLRSWSGQGFNLIWRPNFGGQSGAKDFFLELNLPRRPSRSRTSPAADRTSASPTEGRCKATSCSGASLICNK